MLLVLACIIGENPISKAKNLVIFTDENYDEYKDKVVFFTTKICETCDKIIPALETFAQKLANEIKNRNITIGIANCLTDRDIC